MALLELSSWQIQVFITPCCFPDFSGEETKLEWTFRRSRFSNFFAFAAETFRASGKRGAKVGSIRFFGLSRSRLSAFRRGEHHLKKSFAPRDAKKDTSCLFSLKFGQANKKLKTVKVEVPAKLFYLNGQITISDWQSTSQRVNIGLTVLS